MTGRDTSVYIVSAKGPPYSGNRRHIAMALLGLGCEGLCPRNSRRADRRLDPGSRGQKWRYECRFNVTCGQCIPCIAVPRSADLNEVEAWHLIPMRRRTGAYIEMAVPSSGRYDASTFPVGKLGKYPVKPGVSRGTRRQTVLLPQSGVELSSSS